ncbi:MAG: hydrolase [Acidimicrobiaceae bacterium]|nr:hydrolase [Acidimicrobiaceae bacterium]
MSNVPAAVLWDMDGTLVDTEPYWFAAEHQLVKSFGNTWSEEHAHAVVGFDLLDTAAYIIEHGGVDLPPRDVVEYLLDAVITSCRQRLPWRPGVRELLDELHSLGIPCALVTMSWRRFAEAVLEQLPRPTFEVTVFGDEVAHGKPHPEPYLRAASLLNVEPSTCVAIEDSPTGVASAQAAGCRVIGVPNMKPLEQIDGVRIISSLTETDAATLWTT